jgi:hypothetical protein
MEHDATYNLSLEDTIYKTIAEVKRGIPTQPALSPGAIFANSFEKDKSRKLTY